MEQKIIGNLIEELEIQGNFNLLGLEGPQGPKGDTGPVGATGPQGPQGEKGDTGPSNILSIGTVEKGDNASATITGTSPNQILNLILPKGDKGIQGDKGDIGATGPSNILSIGTVKKGDNASATITGTSPSQVLNLVLPKGDKGDTGATGPQGETGATGPSNILTIGTVTSGDTASATITGTSPSQVLNLVLPKGDTGEIGPQGPQGEIGPIGPQGEKGETGATGATGQNGADGISITNITAGIPTQSGDYTVTPITFNKSDSTSQTVNIQAKNGLDGSQGTIDYTELENKPKINNIELNGNKTLSDLGIQQTVISETKPTDDSVKVWIDPSGDGVTVPTKLSELENDCNFLKSESDPTVPSHVKNITQENINSWNGKSNFSGSYNDLANKPSIPQKVSDLVNDSNFITSAIFSYDSDTGTLTITTAEV